MARTRERAREGLDRVRRHLDPPRRVLVRDFVIFEVKLLLDGLKDLVVSQAAIAAFIVDFVRPRGRSWRLFYRVLDIGERVDSWLSLYGPSRRAAEDPEGLFGESRAGSPTLLGRLEAIVHRVVVGRPGEWTNPTEEAEPASPEGEHPLQDPEQAPLQGPPR
jgi:hypothetical protein